jgi:tight adherence protein B
MSGSNLILILVGASAFTIILLVLSAFSGGKDDRFERRLLRVGGRYVEARKKAAKARPMQSMRRLTADSGIPLLDILIKKLLPNPDKLRSRLARTGYKMSLGEYLLINLIAIGVAIIALRYWMDWSKAPSLLLGMALGLYVPHKIVAIIGNRRIRKFLANFPEAIDTMCRGLRSGLPVTESIAAVGRELPDPVGIEFRRISDGVRMGRSLEDSMWDITRRIDAPEFRFLIIAMAIQKETGGNLAETLDNLSDLIRKRRQLRLKIRAMSAEARASAMIIGSLPFVMFTLLWLVNHDYVMTLFRTLKGNVLLGFGLGMISIGCLVMGKMIRFEL